MSRKNVFDYKVLDLQSLAASFESTIINVKNVDYGSAHIYWTGSSPIGSLTVQAKNSDSDSFYTLEIGPASISGSSGDHVFIFNSFNFQEFKFVYTRTSGSGNMTINFIAKQGA